MSSSEDYFAFTGRMSFLRCMESKNLDGVDMVVMGVPFDNGVSGRPGARLGPKAVRESSVYIGTFLNPWDYDITEKFNIIDYGDVGAAIGKGAMECMISEAYENAKKIIDSGAKLLTIGGDHSIPYGPIRAASEKYGKLALLHFDSHEDYTPDDMTDICHCTFMYDLAQEACYDPEKSVQVFIRESPLVDNPCNIIHADEAIEMGPENLAAKIKKIIGDMPVYLTFDIDALDAVYACGTGTPVVGGPTSREVLSLIRKLRGLNVVAADIVEVAPMYDSLENTQQIAATIARDLLYLMAESTI